MSTPEGTSAWDALIADLERVTQERDAALAALNKHGRHEDACEAWSGRPCNCGLTYALRDLS